MPLLKTYKGHPVAHMRRRKTADASEPSITLKLVSTRPGGERPKLVISQEDWDAHGTETFYEANEMPDVRELAKSAGRP